MKGYILLHARPGMAGKLILEIEKLSKNFPAIKEYDGVYGTFDLVVKVEDPREEEFIRTLSAIGAAENVTATNTLLTAPHALLTKYMRSSD